MDVFSLFLYHVNIQPFHLLKFLDFISESHAAEVSINPNS